MDNFHCCQNGHISESDSQDSAPIQCWACDETLGAKIPAQTEPKEGETPIIIVVDDSSDSESGDSVVFLGTGESSVMTGKRKQAEDVAVDSHRAVLPHPPLFPTPRPRVAVFAPPGRVACPHCSRNLKTQRGLVDHIKDKHKASRL